MMSDIVSPEKRSEMMSSIKGKDTKPEMIVRKALFRMGFRYRIHYKGLSGKPDIVFPKYKAVIFVNGCFWHGHDCHLFKLPKSNREFWKEKITGNQERDEKNIKRLEEKGWRVWVVWECALKGKSESDILKEIDSISTWLLGDRESKQSQNKKGT